jgi:hypothetical protein
MAQAYEDIGRSPAERGFIPFGRADGTSPPAEPLGAAETDQAMTIYGRRYNRQALGLTIDNLASYREEPMAARTVYPYDPDEPLPRRRG